VGAAAISGTMRERATVTIWWTKPFCVFIIALVGLHHEDLVLFRGWADAISGAYAISGTMRERATVTIWCTKPFWVFIIVYGISGAISTVNIWCYFGKRVLFRAP